MQLLLSASVLVPVGVGAVLAGVLLILVVFAARRRTRGAATPGTAGIAVTEATGPLPETAGGAPAPGRVPVPPGERTEGGTAEQTNGEPAAQPPPAASAPMEPAVPAAPATPPCGEAEPPADPPRAAPVRLPPRPHEAGSPRSVAAAVAQAFAVRAAAGRAGAQRPTRGTNGAGPVLRRQEPDEPQVTAPRPHTGASDGRENAAHDEQPPDGRAAPPQDGRPEQTEPGLAAGVNRARDTAAAASGEEPGADAAAQRSGAAGRLVPGHGANEDGSVRSGYPARWTDGRGAVPPPRPEHALDGTSRPQLPGWTAAGGRASTDVRDRLLAVLLDDPERAVGAAEELARCLRALESLTDALRHEREVLRDVLRRLADAGLCAEQLAQLAGIPLADVEALLAPAQQQAQAQ
jgi:hypothetical protein